MEEKKLKPFDLEKAKAGEKLITRDGHPAKIICFNREHKTDHIVALIEYTEDGETIEDMTSYTDQGTFFDDGSESDYDLFMAPAIVERWVNVYKDENGGYYNGGLYDSEEMALQNKDVKDYITTKKITWEE